MAGVPQRGVALLVQSLIIFRVISSPTRGKTSLYSSGGPNNLAARLSMQERMGRGIKAVAEKRNQISAPIRDQSFAPVSTLMRKSRQLIPVRIKRDKTPPGPLDGDENEPIQYQQLKDYWSEIEPAKLTHLNPIGIAWAIIKMLASASKLYIKITFFWWAMLTFWMIWDFFFQTYWFKHWGMDSHWMHEVKKHMFGPDGFVKSGSAGMAAKGGFLWSSRGWRQMFPEQWYPG